MKKIILIVTIVVIVLALGITTAILVRGRNNANVIPEIEVESNLIETPLEERPYVTLTPRADGKEFTLEISHFGSAETIEYELVYLSQGLSRGVVGSVKVDGESFISRDLLLGTCSKKVCKYDEGVEEGTLTLRFRGEEGIRKFTAEFHIQQGDDELTSLDENFTFTGSISKIAYYITMSTIGLPKSLEGEVISGPYGSFTSGTSIVKNGEVSFVLTNTEVDLYSWSGKAWEKEEISKEDGMISTSVGSLSTFIVVSP